MKTPALGEATPGGSLLNSHLHTASVPLLHTSGLGVKAVSCSLVQGVLKASTLVKALRSQEAGCLTTLLVF